MVLLKSIVSLFAYGLLLQSCVNAVPVKQKHPLLHKSSSLNGKFLHITDIHIDPNYKKGASTSNYCHDYSSRKRSSSKSGKYGALGSECDTPPALVDATFDYLGDNINDIDFILYTGDTVRHDRDKGMPRTSTEVVNAHKEIIKYFKNTYDLDDIPMVITIGNNDPYTHNSVKKNDKIFTELQKIWADLNLNLTSSFKTGGFFVQDLLKNKLSIVNLNTMLFYDKNDEVEDCDDDSSEAYAQMVWFEKILKTYSKKSNHKLYIMGHVPPMDEKGNEIYKSECFNQYINLIGEYGDSIAGHFNGHTNKDTLYAIFNDGDDYTYMNAGSKDAKDEKDELEDTVMGIFNAPSIIPKHNPGFRVYTYETNSDGDYPVGTILDWDQYYLDLNKANEEDEVEYELEYTASDFYNVDHFDGSGVGEAVYNIGSSKTKRKTYKLYEKIKPSKH